MITITHKNAMIIYGELVKCYYGSNSYDEHTAEIYAYVLTDRSPGYMPPNKRGKVTGEWYDKEDIDSANNLKIIIELFLKQFGLTWNNIEIAGYDGENGLEELWKDGFSHRVHVKVVHNE